MVTASRAGLGAISTCTCRHCWARDPQRRKKAGIPEGLAFATKPELALEQVKRLIAGGLRRAVGHRPTKFTAGPATSGPGSRALGLSYVAIVPCDTMITFAKNKVTRADQAIREAVFEQRSCGNGAKGPPLRGLGAARHAGPRRSCSADSPPCRDREKNQYTF